MIHNRVPVVCSVTPHSQYWIRLRFDDGLEGDLDIAALISFTGVFQPLQDPEFFREVRVNSESGTITWPNGADLDPLVLYELVTRSHPGNGR
jgi:hypothetical protein